jgi:hypothetical protein
VKAAGLVEPEWLVFAPVDFEREKPLGGPDESGVWSQPAGVLPVARHRTVSDARSGQVHSEIYVQGSASCVVFDYAEPFQNYPAERRASVMAVADSAAARGEPWLSLSSAFRRKCRQAR